MTKKIYKAYCSELPFIDVPPIAKVYSRAPTTADTNYSIGFPWVYKPTADTATTYAFGGINSSGGGIWVLQGPGASDVDTINGLSPVAGNIIIDGGTNITDSNAGNTVTLNLDAAITLATSVTSPLYTAAAATDVAITAAAGQDIVLKVGDAAGANKLSLLDSADVEVFAVDSNGALTFSGLTVAGAFTQTGGAANIGMDNAANAVNIAGGTAARAVTILSGAAAHTLAIGSAAAGAISIDTAAGISLDGATASNFTVTGASADLTLASVGGSVNLDGSEAAADAISIQASNAAGGIDVDFGTGGLAVDGVGGAYVLTSDTASNINVTGAGIDLTLDSAAGRVVVNGEEAAANAITLLSAAGGLDVDVALQMNLDSSQAAADAIVINASAGGVDITAVTNDLDLKATAASVVIDGGEAAADAVTITSSNAGGGIDCDSGTAGTAIDSTGAVSIDGAAASNFSVSGAGIDLTLASAAGRVVVNGEEAADNAITLLSAAGGIDADAALQINIASSEATADAVVINASAGGMDISCDGAANDVDIGSTAGSINLVGAEAAGDAIVLNASDAAGGIDFLAGTGKVSCNTNFVLGSVATQFEMNGGAATDFIGTGTFTNGQVTIANTNIAANDRIFIQRSAINASTALGAIIYTISAGVNFVVESKDLATPANDETGDQSSFVYFIVREN